MSDSRANMEFGLFIPPQHYPKQNPTRALQRDLETIEYVETLGFHEAWIGEHHSSGFEFIGAPDIFIAAAAERTKRIRLGTGVVSLPYHQPFNVAERAVLLDHLTMGRSMLGVGPGSLPTDAAMMGIPWSETRARMVQSWEAVYHLLTTQEPLTSKTDWFTLDQAVLQLRPYSHPTMELAFTAMESPFGPSLAGKYGGGLISIGATTPAGYSALSKHWAVVEEQAALHSQTVDRKNWRVVTMIHVAETREQAKAEVARGLPGYVEYTAALSERTLDWVGGGAEPPPGIPTVDDIVAGMGSTKIACIGTPDDAIEMIRGVVETTGGFGKVLLLMGTDWTSQEALFRGLELFSREVMPAFQGSYDSLVDARDRVKVTLDERRGEQRASIKAAQENYQGAVK